MPGQLEALIHAVEQNTVALNANTEALGGAAAPATGGGKPAAGKPAATGKPAAGKTGAGKTNTKPQHTQDEVTALLNKVKDEHGIEAARELFSDVAPKMSQIPADKLDEVFGRATEFLANQDAGGGEELEEL